MYDIKAVVKELKRIADANERIAKALEKQNRTITINPTVCINGDSNDNQEAQ